MVAALVARVVLLAMVTITPWIFGGVQATVQVWLLVGVVGALACWAVLQWSDQPLGTTLPLAAIPLMEMDCPLSTR